jgi:NADH-quinone oxidoreductase subunit M
LRIQVSSFFRVSDFEFRVFIAMLIPLLILIPLFGAAALLLPVIRSPRDIRVLTLLFTLATLAVALVVAGGFNWADTAALQYAGAAPWVPGFGLFFGFGVDAVSLWLVLLTTVLMPITILGAFTALHGKLEERSREFFFWLLVLEAAMLGTFVATDVIFFYICFEFTLVPLFFLIGVFGSKGRLKAATVFFLYTFTGSMLTFAGILYVAYVHAHINGAWSFAIADLTATAQGLTACEQSLVLLALLSGFAVKVPLFPLHTWLPLAHTEAPTAGSVILAGVLLKLGTYGLLRFALPMTPLATVAAAPVIGVFAVIGILYTALICWVQTDIKKLIAYSSVSHLGFCVLGLFALTSNAEHSGIGQVGAVMYMINHGLSTGALFLCVGMIYERFHIRDMPLMGGLAKVMPVWTFFMVFFSLASVGLPGLNGFIGEFLTLLGAFTAPQTMGPWYAAVAGVGMIFGAIYILFMVGKVVFGPLKVPHVDPAWDNGRHGPRDLSLREIVVLTPLALGCLWLGVYPQPVLDSLAAPIAALTAPAEGVIRQQTADAKPQALPLTLGDVGDAVTHAPGRRGGDR